QRRLAGMISLGVQQLVEIYFHKLHVIEPGSQIKHEWFNQSLRKLKLKLQPMVTVSIENLPGLDEILYIATQIELQRNEIVYGVPLDEDTALREKIDLFLELKKLVEELTGEPIDPTRNP
ncbi:MAG TPA: hypothetical protein VKK79_14565, partial [Candidatus Lokiarchaeia archaeon]|nr:hypothetical protein [Candidatus Lokiarchaeia archaeon]